MKKLFAIITVVAMMLSMSVIASADQSATISYDGSTAVITINTTDFETYDVGVVSDLTPSIEYPMDFAMGVVMNSALTFSKVENAAAVDAAGNSYAVLTGAGCDKTTGAPVAYDGTLATLTYTDVAEGTEFLVVSGTAAVDDVKTATEIVTLVAKSESEPVPTESEPVPTESEPVPTESEPVPTESEPVPTESTDPEPTESTDPEPSDEPKDEDKTKAPATGDSAIYAMVTLSVVAGLAIVVLKKRATN